MDDLLGIGPREVQEFDDADGFVSRERDQVDRRRHIVMITAASRRHFDGVTHAQREVEDALFGGLDNDQRQQLRSALVALRDSLAGAHEPACPRPPASSIRPTAWKGNPAKPCIRDPA